MNTFTTDPTKPSLRTIVTEHAPFVRRTLAQLGVPARDLPDVEQEVRRGVAGGLPTLDPVANVRAWLHGICERQAAYYRRAQAHRRDVLPERPETGESIEDEDTPADERIDAARGRALLALLLADIEPERRAVIVAYELDGLAMRDVAHALGIPLNTGWNRLRLARNDLRAEARRRAAQEGHHAHPR